MNIKKSKLKVIFSLLWLTILIGGGVLVSASSLNINDGSNEFTLAKPKRSYSLKEKRQLRKTATHIKIKRLKNKRDNNSKLADITINGLEVERKPIHLDEKISETNFKLDLTSEETKAVQTFNQNISENQELIPLSVEELSVDEVEEESGNILVNLLDGVLGTKKINAATKVTKTNYWGVGYEVFKSGSQILFCVEYGPLAGTSYSGKSLDLKKYLKDKMKWSASRVEKARKQALWGVYYTKKSGASTTKGRYSWYASAQSLIWNNKYHPGAKAELKTKINERVSKHDKLPSFNGKTHVVQAGKSLTLKDTNTELSSWFSLNNAAAFKSATGMNITKRGNSLVISNPANNIKNAKSILQLNKYQGQLPNDSEFSLYGKGIQTLGYFSDIARPKASVTIQAAPLEKGKIGLKKLMDDIDLYGQIVRDHDSNPVYLSKDGQNIITDGSVTIDTLKYASKEVIQTNNLWNKPIEFKYPVVVEKKMLVDDGYALDKEGNRIQKTDSNGEPLFEEDGMSPKYEMIQKEVTATDDKGNIIYTAKLNENGEQMYESTTISGLNYPSEKEMDNIYNGEGVQFSLSGNGSEQILTVNANGEAISSDLVLNQKYTIKELKTKEGFNLLSQIYTITPTIKDGITWLNAGKELINYTRSAKVNVIKIDKATHKPLENVLFGIYEQKNNTCDKSVVVPDNLIWSGLSDIEGKINWDTGRAQKVCLVELDSLGGYYSEKNIDTVTLEYDKTVTIQKENQAMNLTFLLNKLNDDKERLANVEFILNVYGKDTTDRTINAQVENNVKLEGNKKLDKANESKQDPFFNDSEEMGDYNYLLHSDKVITDEKGQFKLNYNSLKKWFDNNGDTYLFEIIETKPIEGYKPKLAPERFFLAYDDKTKSWQQSDSSYSIEKNLDFKATPNNQVAKITMLNHKQQGYARLIKKAADDKSRQVATYRLTKYDKNDKIYESKQLKSSKTIDVSESFALRDTSKVCLVEIKAPKNFALDPQEKCQTTVNLKDEEVLTFEFFNKRIELLKTGYSFFDLFR